MFSLLALRDKPSKQFNLPSALLNGLVLGLVAGLLISLVTFVFAQMQANDIDIRPAGQADLEAINRVIEAAVMTWHLPDRVKRHALDGKFLGLVSPFTGGRSCECVAIAVNADADRVYVADVHSKSIRILAKK